MRYQQWARFWLLAETLQDPTYQYYYGSTYPLSFCDQPDAEPPCTPRRPGEYDGGVERGPAPSGDRGGDGITDDLDNCKKVFNPIRPLDAGVRPDADGDGRGDACDRCPLAAGPTCTAVDPYTGREVLVGDAD